MFEFDVTDEAVISAQPSVVYAALLGEFEGETGWWRPWAAFRRRSERATGEVGAVHEITSRHRSRPVVFVMKTVEIRKNELIRARYVEGAFRGEGLWKLTAQENGTNVSYRWRVRPKGLLPWVIALAFDAPKAQSEIMKAGFRALERHLARST